MVWFCRPLIHIISECPCWIIRNKYQLSSIRNNGQTNPNYSVIGNTCKSHNLKKALKHSYMNQKSNYAFMPSSVWNPSMFAGAYTGCTIHYTRVLLQTAINRFSRQYIPQRFVTAAFQSSKQLSLYVHLIPKYWWRKGKDFSKFSYTWSIVGWPISEKKVQKRGPMTGIYDKIGSVIIYA